MQEEKVSNRLIEIKNRSGSVIFSLRKEDNSVKDTLEEAVRQCVDLSEANLSYIDIQGANLSGGKFCYSIFAHSNLSGVNFSDANIAYSEFYYANLDAANFSGADCTKACFYKSKSVPDMPMACPKEGAFIGWKKITNYKENYDGDFIVKLEIPEDAKRSSATTNKCRCSKAKVLEIKNIETGECVDKITNKNITSCVYKVGKYVYPDSFDEDRWYECSHGIHFFMTEQEAKEY